MIILPDYGEPETILTIVVVVAVHHEDLKLGVRNLQLRVEIQALDPVIVVKVAGRPVVTVFIGAGDLEGASEGLCRILYFSDGNGGRSGCDSARRRERCFAEKLLNSHTVDVFDRIARGCRFRASRVKHGLGNFDTAAPDGREVALEPARYSPLAGIVIKRVASPLHKGAGVAWIIPRIDKLDLEAITLGAFHSDVESFKSLVWVDGQELDFLVGMVMAGAVCLLKLNSNSKVIAA